MNYHHLVHSGSHAELSNYQAQQQRPSFSSHIAHHVAALKFGANKSRTLAGFVSL